MNEFIIKQEKPTDEWYLRINDGGPNQGKIVAICPTERLARMVLSAFGWQDSESATEVDFNGAWDR